MRLDGKRLKAFPLNDHMVPLMDEERREILDALSDKTRLAILEAASANPMTGDGISDAVQRSRSTVESHLSTLLRLGLIARTKDDKRYYYQSTEKARLWMGQSVPALSSPDPVSKGRATPTLIVVLIVGTVAGAYYALMNSFILPIPIWLFAAMMGIICAWIFRVLKRLLQTFFITSLVLATISAAVGFEQFSPLNAALLFAFSIAFLVVIGLPAWYLTRRLRVAFSRKRAPSPDRQDPSQGQLPGLQPSR
jgi:DNA-binding transcriptional ArsR family regulator